ncbi:MAG: 16S rRNA (uracil(1498)-N(3))-methyltransferase [Deltaproteobacteria bacterium]|nr:16S rRNA (uracil(1498)-N(3))-methyltransferase [Deltaproteobacteria bacterium]
MWFFISPESVSDSQVLLRGPEAHHMASVLRKKEGESVELFDGKGRCLSGRILEAGGDFVRIKIDKDKVEPFVGPKVVLGQSLAKGEKIDWVIQKGTEIGVSEIYLIEGERAVVHPKESSKGRKEERWQRIAVEACKQSQQPYVPVVHGIVSLQGFLEKASNVAERIFFWERSEQQPKAYFRSLSKIPSEIWIAIGPEGGWSDAEVEMAHRNRFMDLSLGRSILRTETAAIAALSMIRYEFSV